MYVERRTPVKIEVCDLNAAIFSMCI